MSVAAGPLTDIQPQPPSARVKTGRAKKTRQNLTESPNPFAQSTNNHMRSHRGCVGLQSHARRFREMLLRFGHKRGGGITSDNGSFSSKPLQILLDSAGRQQEIARD